MSIKAVIVFDPIRIPKDSQFENPEDALAEAKLLYYYSAGVQVERAEQRSQAGLIQGVVDFTTFVSTCGGDKPESTQPVSVETEQLRYLIKEIEKNIFLTICFDRIGITESVCNTVFDRFTHYYFLLHGSIINQLNRGFALNLTMDDFVPSFIAAEATGVTRSVPLAIRYAPVDAHALVSVHAVGLELLTEFNKASLCDFAILYRGFLVSSSIDPDSLAPLYAYLAQNPVTGDVSNIKLLRPPYGRIGTPAAVEVGGGSSAFGRCNYFDADNNSNGFLFGATGAGEGIFSPKIYLNNNTEGFLIAYLINGMMVVGISKEKPSFVMLKRLETFLSDNNELNDETLPLLRSDYAKAMASKGEGFDFVYLNKISKSLIPIDSALSRKDMKRASSFFTSRFMYPFSDRPGSSAKTAEEETRGDVLDSNINVLADYSQDISQIAVKSGSNDGWKVFMRKGKDREMKFDFKDTKLPLWKVNSDISNFLKVKFESVAL
jgi:hypothetical protein